MNRNIDITKYINRAEPIQAEIMGVLRELIHAIIPNLTEAIKWGFPVFSLDKDIVYFRSNKQHVTLGFHSATKLQAFRDVLVGSGKNMRHIKIHHPDQIDQIPITEILKLL